MFKVIQHDQRSLNWWYEQFKNGTLNLQPTYQRRSELWSKWKRAHLIDSILNDFDVPKFYVADFTSIRSAKLNEKQTPYAIIDGKQRFETIFAFFEGGLTLNDSTTFEADPTAQIGGLDYTQLSSRYPTLAKKVENFKPVVMSVISDNREMIEQMFIRLNSGEAVNRAERRNALPGPMPAIVRNLTLHPFFQKNIRFNVKRMQEHNLAAKIYMIEHEGAFCDTKAKNIDNFYEEAFERVEGTLKKPVTKKDREEALTEYSDTEARVFENLEKLSKVFRERDPLLGAQGHIPVYYWLARERKLKNDFREFLEGFTRNVLKNLRTANEEPSKANQELLVYYTRGRTTNDQGSLEDRYKILTKHYERFRKS